MPHPAPGWIDRLPQNRLIAEYSMWSADLIRLADDLDRIALHADILHVDVADGVFAPSFNKISISLSATLRSYLLLICTLSALLTSRRMRRR